MHPVLASTRLTPSPASGVAHSRRFGRGFSLIELVVVVVILGIIGAIAIPRVSRAAQNAEESALVADLAALRSAIEQYNVDHGDFPSASDFEDQLTLFTDRAGSTNATADSTHIFGPYLRTIPTLKVGSKAGLNAVAGTTGASTAWLYDETTGEIRADLPAGETDATGKPYNTF